MEFELKFREAFMSLISIEIYWKFLELWISKKFGQQAPCYTLLQEKSLVSKLLVTPYCKKNPFTAKDDQKVEFHSK
jgi:hypothetical protein